MSENGRWLFVESARDCPEATILASDKFTMSPPCENRVVKAVMDVKDDHC